MRPRYSTATRASSSPPSTTTEQLGASYWSAIADKAAPTSDIAKLAEQITNGIEDRRAQAEAIDRWVKQNIRYVGVYLGTGP